MRRHDGAGNGGHGGSGGRSVRRNRFLALAILAILGLAAVAPAGQASSQASAELQAQRALNRAQRAAERDTRRQQREAEKAAHKAAHREVAARNQARREALAEERAAVWAANKESVHATVKITCTSIVVNFHGFNATPAAPQQINEKVVFKQSPSPQLSYVFAPPVFSVDGSEATQEIKIAAPLGDSRVGIRAHFAGNGVHGSFNIREPLTCGPNSQYSLVTAQAIGGSAFTTATLPGAVGETVDYQTTARNEGNTPLHFGAFSSPGCDGTPTGGTGTGVAVQPRETVTWYCHHTLTEADHAGGVFANAGSVTATPEFDPFTTSILHTSSGVLVSPIAAGPGSGSDAGNEITVASAPASSAPSKGVLGFSSSAVPSLRGPAKCVRGPFTVSVKSAGVASVIFYIDGRRLARRTAHSAKGGLISIHVNGALLKAGTHRLKATITMLPGSSTAKAVVASRARVVRRCSTVKHS